MYFLYSFVWLAKVPKEVQQKLELHTQHTLRFDLWLARMNEEVQKELDLQMI